MTDDLHDVLDRTADLAGSADFDSAALWREATRTKRRHGALTALSVVAVLALVSLTVWWGGGSTTPGSVAPPASAVTIPAMPSTLYAVPSSVRPTSARLDIDLVAAVLVSQGGVPVAVSALDGSYHPLKLPGYDEPSADVLGPNPAIAVSPTGSLLAYAWHAAPPAVSGTHVPSGIRVIDTRSGRITTYPVPGGVAAVCGGLSWSANERYLGYSCTIDSEFDASGSRGQVFRVERLDLSSGTRMVVPLGQGSRGVLAVRDDGSVAAARGGSVEIWYRRTFPPVQRTTTSVPGEPTSVSWLGLHQLVVAAPTPEGGSYQRVVVRLECDFCPPPVPGTGNAFSGPVRHLAGPVRTAGTVGPDLVALWVLHGQGGELYTWSPAHGLVGKVAVEGWSPSDDYSFATDLLRSPTRETSEPHWPTSWTARVDTAATWVVVMLAVVLAILLLVSWARGRRLRRLTAPPHCPSTLTIQPESDGEAG